MVPDDDEQACSGDPCGVAAREPGKPARAPEDVREAGHGDRVAQDRDVARCHPVVEKRLDDGERARPHHDDREQRDVRSCVHCSGQRTRRLHREVSTSCGARYFLGAREPRSPSSPCRRRHLHAGPGHRADDPQHARRRTIERRRDRGGVSLGQAVWTVAASAGVVALLTASEPVFRTLKLVGAAYLVYLGAQSLWAAIARRAHEHAVRASVPLSPRARSATGRPLEPRQPEDGRLLREPPAAVRARRDPRRSRSSSRSASSSAR